MLGTLSPSKGYEVLSPLDFLAEFTQHIPAKGAHLVRYYGWYSNKSRCLRLKAAKALAPQPAVAAEEGSAPARPCNFTWAKLIKRVYEVDPLRCPKCGTTMKVVSFIEPPQQEVIEKILKHCGLWEEPAPLRPVGRAEAFKSMSAALDWLREQTDGKRLQANRGL